MEQQNQNSHTSAQTKQQLLDITDTESGPTDEVSKDFFEQNQMISEEISKYDQLLTTCPMLMFRAWIVFCAVWTLGGCFYIVLNFDVFFSQIKQIFGHLSYLMLLLMVLASFVTLWGCILMWIALHSKSLQKMERSLSIFKLNARFIIVFYSCMFVLQALEKALNWVLAVAYLVSMLFGLIPVLPAIRLRNILAARNVFDQVSSFPNNKA